MRVETWAERAGMRRRTIERAIRELVVAGVLEAWHDPDRRWKQVNVWKLTAHPGDAPAPHPPGPRSASYVRKQLPTPEHRTSTFKKSDPTTNGRADDVFDEDEW